MSAEHIKYLNVANSESPIDDHQMRPKQFELPTIIQTEDTYFLADLIRSDFPISETDRAFTLSHEDLIKCTSILLYKFNLEAQKNQYQRSELTTMVNERIDKTEATFRSQFLEVNEFLHTLHQ